MQIITKTREVIIEPGDFGSKKQTTLKLKFENLNYVQRDYYSSTTTYLDFNDLVDIHIKLSVIGRKRQLPFMFNKFDIKVDDYLICKNCTIVDNNNHYITFKSEFYERYFR